ncbi:hypothetical protein HYW19_04245 [Candidatus Woesearchaeota archaeon]|nr:hypothetical protein [Candidatus Woesearchaeota archaeon]
MVNTDNQLDILTQIRNNSVLDNLVRQYLNQAAIVIEVQENGQITVDNVVLWMERSFAERQKLRSLRDKIISGIETSQIGVEPNDLPTYLFKIAVHNFEEYNANGMYVVTRARLRLLIEKILNNEFSLMLQYVPYDP